MDGDLLQAALTLVQRGFAVLPLHSVDDAARCTCGRDDCRSPGKHPRVERGVHDASTDPHIVREWWARWPDASIGIATGNGLVVIDVDPRNGGDVIMELLEEAHGRLPPGPRVRTGGGGWHAYFRCVPGAHVPVALGPGVDVKADSGYVVAPPSRHASGRRYVGQDEDAEVPMLPQWIIDAAMPPRSSATSKPGPTAVDLKRLESALVFVDADDRATWIKVGLALHHDAGEDGRDLWDRWSQTSAKFDADDQERTWARFRPHASPVGVGTIIFLARQGGWPDLTESDEPPDGPAAADPGATPDSDAGWEEPVPLPGAAQPTSLPLHSFDPSTCAFIEGLSIHLQVPTDAVVSMLLAVIATAVQGKFRVRFAARLWSEPLGLFVACFMEPGSRKSALLSELAAPVNAWMRHERERLMPESRRIAALRRSLEQQGKRLERSARDARDGAAEMELHRIDEALAQLQEPFVPDCLVDDATPEAIAIRLQEQRGCCAVLSAESDIISNMAGRYSNDDQPRHQVFLKAHAGDPVSVTRTTRSPIRIDAPVMTLGLCVQPAILHQLAGKRVLRDTGLLARFLYALPENRVGWRDANPPKLDNSMQSEYGQRLRRILTLPGRLNPDGQSYDPYVIELDDGAGTRLIEFAAELEARMQPGSDLHGLRDWTSKLAGAVMRICGILCVWEAQDAMTQMTEPPSPADSVSSVMGSCRVNADLMDRAIGLARALIEHAKAAFGLMSADPVVEQALAVLRWIQCTGLASFSVRDAHRATQAACKTADEAKRAIDKLVQHGYVRPIEMQTTGPGRPPSRTYLVSPLVLAACRRTLTPWRAQPAAS